MADKLKVWFDAEADFLEVRFSEAPGYEKETNNDAVMERVDAEGRVIGFSIMGVSQFKKGKPLEADLVSAEESWPVDEELLVIVIGYWGGRGREGTRASLPLKGGWTPSSIHSASGDPAGFSKSSFDRYGPVALPQCEFMRLQLRFAWVGPYVADGI